MTPAVLRTVPDAWTRSVTGVCEPNSIPEKSSVSSNGTDAPGQSMILAKDSSIGRSSTQSCIGYYTGIGRACQ